MAVLPGVESPGGGGEHPDREEGQVERGKRAVVVVPFGRCRLHDHAYESDRRRSSVSCRLKEMERKDGRPRPSNISLPNSGDIDGWFCWINYTQDFGLLLSGVAAL